MTTTFDADHVFAALSDGTRRDIVLRALGGREGVAELAEHYPMSFAAVQKHVAVLERAGLVSKQRTVAARSCTPTSRGSSWRAACSTGTRRLWRGRIDRMTDLIASSKETQPHDLPPLSARTPTP